MQPKQVNNLIFGCGSSGFLVVKKLVYNKKRFVLCNNKVQLNWLIVALNKI
jgi:hypothetical protein